MHPEVYAVFIGDDGTTSGDGLFVGRAETLADALSVVRDAGHEPHPDAMQYQAHDGAFYVTVTR
jgi:hypothetical protein